jgi:predicted MFS family arabinose efflux permease
MLNAGNAIAATIAAPLGSFLGDFIGWRGAFALVVPLGLIALVYPSGSSDAFYAARGLP